MYLDKTKKAEIFARCGKVQSTTDTGLAESQIALLSYHIKHLAGYMKKNHRDYITIRSLTQFVDKRHALLGYPYDRDVERYRATIKALDLRK